MSLLWTSVSAMLALELVVFFALCTPLPWGVRKNISRWIFRVKAQQRLDTFFKYILALLLIALAESVHAIYTLHARAEFGAAGGDASVRLAAMADVRWRRARSERNVYMAAFAISLMVGIMRLVKLASIEVRLRTKIKEYNGNRPLTETGETVAEIASSKDQ